MNTALYVVDDQCSVDSQGTENVQTIIPILKYCNPIVKQAEGMSHNMTSCSRIRLYLVHQKTGAYKKKNKPRARQSDEPVKDPSLA